MRFFIHLSYCGTAYHGWQKQPNNITVQEKLDFCLSKLIGKDIETLGCGRTDSGVHAIDFYAHFDVEEQSFIEEDLTFRLNRFLPKDITVKKVFKVQDDFHARFDAKWREYEYWTIFQKDAFLIDRALLLPSNVDVNKMQEAASLLPHYNDFQCFSKVHTDVNNFNCTIHLAEFEKRGDLLVFKIRANRFLRNMVRAIVGTLIEVGKGNASIEEFKKIIESKDRREAGTSIDAHALYLSKVEYDFNSNK
ncbi:MAG: tRNA pseudouridine(38-40) synthase TruA [Flavobacteriales bacterium]